MDSRSARLGFMGFLLLLLASGDVDSGTVISSMSLEELTRAAGAAFAGTVDSVRTDVLEVRLRFRNEMPVRSVYFSRLEFAKGRPRPKLVLKIAGSHAIGPLAPVVQHLTTGETVTSVDLRREFDCVFEAGERYVVLCDSSLGIAADHYWPIAGFHQGYFLVETDTTGATVMHDRYHRPVGVSEASFLEAIRTYAAK